MSTTAEHGRVVRILSRYEVVTDLGTEHEVVPGDKLQIYELGEAILDPDTGEDLGRLELVKATVAVKSVQPGMCVARTPTTGSGAFGNMFAGLAGPQERVKLNVDAEEVEPMGFTNIVRKGDLVRKVSS